ncbi:HKD family nuclease [Devosia sp. 2618]
MKTNPKHVQQGENRKERRVSSLQNIIAEADRGQLLADAEDAIEEILTALSDEHDRTGEVTIKVKFKTKNGAVQIMPELAHKLSKPERLATVMFLSDDGELTRRDPRQPVMPSVVDADELNRRR